MNRIRLVIFDFDGTLCDTQRIVVATQQQAIQKMGWPVPEAKVCAATIGLKIKDCFQTLCPDMTDEEADKCIRIYRILFEENKKTMPPTLFPFVSNTLHCLKKRGILMAVASSRSSQSLREMLKEFCIDDVMSWVVGAEDVPNPKPHPEAVLHILRQSGVSAKETLVVGDMPVDIQMGRAAGTFTCGVTYGNSDYKRLSASSPSYILNCFPSILGIAKHNF